MQLQGLVKQIAWLSGGRSGSPLRVRHPGSDLTNPIQESAAAWNQLYYFCKRAAALFSLISYRACRVCVCVCVCPRPKQIQFPRRSTFFFFFKD